MAEVGLTEFLLARIAEDEAAARYALKYTPDSPDLERQWAWLLRYRPTGMKRPFSTWHQDGAPSPNRVLAECDAKRRIVAEHRLITDRARLVKVWMDPTPGVACERCANDPLGSGPLEDIGPCDTLLFLALPYADHPDYREEWRP